MPNASPVQSDFSNGEIGQLVTGRVDFDKYKHSVGTMLNWVATLQGPPIRRPGTVFVAAAKDSAHYVRLIPFVFNATQSYVIELGHQYARFYTQEGQLLVTALIAGISKAASAVVTTAASHALVVGETVTFSGVVGMTQINGLTGTVTAVGDSTHFTVNINSSGFSVYVSGGLATAIQEIVTPYTSAALSASATDLDTIFYVQSADTLYLFHPSYPAQKITRTAAGTFQIQAVSWTDGPYFDVVPSATLTFPSNSGNVTVTCSANIFAATDVGRLVRVKQSDNHWYRLVITNFTNSTTVNMQWLETGHAAETDSVFRLGLWSGTTGYPNCGAFHEGRLWAGAGPASPLRIVSSNSNDFENMAPSPETTDSPLSTSSVVIDITSQEINQVTWLSSHQKGLQVGTLGSEFLITPGSTSDFIQPASAFARIQSNLGSDDVQPVKVDRATIFVQRAGTKIREMFFFFLVDGFDSEDLTVLNDLVTGTGVKALTVTREPFPVVWCLRNDGVIAGCTYKRDTSALRVGWHRHVIGGRSSAGGDPTIVRSITSIPTATAPPGNGVQDELWLAVQRFVNGSTVIHIEYMAPYYNNMPRNYALPVDALQVDCLGTRTDGNHVTAATNANPCVITVDGSVTVIAGDTVTIDGVRGMTQLNGNIFRVKTVAGSNITLQDAGGTDLNSTGYGVYTAGPPGSKLGFMFKRTATVPVGSYLEGETISVLADASPNNSQVVASGTTTLNNSAGFMTWGYPFNSDLALLRFDAGSATGSSEGKTQQIHRASVRVENTGGLKGALNSYSDLQPLVLPPANAIAGLGFALLNGPFTVQLNKGGKTRNETIVFRVSDPLPATILSVAVQLETSDAT